MIKKFISLSKNPVVAGGIVIFFGNNFSNALNYLYHMITGRLLGPSDYSVLASVISFILLLNILPQSLSLVIVKFVSAAKDSSEIESFNKYLFKKLILVTLIITAVAFVISPLIANFLKIDLVLILLAILSIMFFLPSVYYRAMLLGLLKFNQYVASLLSENLIKLALGIILILAGYKVFGAVMGLIIGSGVGLLVARLSVKLKTDKISEVSSFSLKPLMKYSLPILIQSIAFASLYTADVLLVKHFFTSHDAGIYAATSNLGKIIFFGVVPISAYIFPVISKKHAQGESFKKVYFLSLLFSMFLCSVLIVLYITFPNIAIKTLYGDSFLGASRILTMFSIFISFITISYLIVSTNLSLNKSKIVVFPLIGAFAQIIGISMFHSSLEMVILVSTIIAGILLSALLVKQFILDKVHLA